MSASWTSGEIELLKDLYPDVPCKDIAALLDCGRSRIYCMARKLGLQKSEEFNSSEISGRLRPGFSNAGKASRFQPGQAAWNKGLHYMPGGRGGETRYRPGNISGRAAELVRPVGSYRVTSEGFLEVKTCTTPGPSNRRWTPVSRLVWEKHNGKIPDGHIVVFRPGMRTCKLEEITIDRIECISRGENARRNHPRSKDPELGRLIQLRGVITRHVNRLSREQKERKAA